MSEINSISDSKECAECGERKTLVNFSRDRSAKDGKCKICRRCKSLQLAARYGVPIEKVRKVNYDKTVPYYLRPERREKLREAARRRRAAMTPEQVEAKRIKTRKWREASPHTSLGTHLYIALRRRPTENPITKGELVEMWHNQNGKCALSGVLMTWRKGKVLPTSISIDRIEQDKGYTAGNVRLVCYSVNLFRGVGTDAEMLAMAKAIVANMEKG